MSVAANRRHMRKLRFELYRQGLGNIMWLGTLHLSLVLGLPWTLDTHLHSEFRKCVQIFLAQFVLHNLLHLQVQQRQMGRHHHMTDMFQAVWRAIISSGGDNHFVVPFVGFCIIYYFSLLICSGLTTSFQPLVQTCQDHSAKSCPNNCIIQANSKPQPICL